MRKETGIAWGENVIRISKKAAKKAFESGLEIFLLPCKANINSIWYDHPCFIEKKTACRDFEGMVRSFEFYNCNLNETGMYVKFFIKA